MPGRCSSIPNCLVLLLPEKPGSHRKADEDYGSSEDLLGYALGEASGDVSADGAGNHGHKTVAPDDLAVDDEENKGHTVGQRGGDDLHGVDLVQVLPAEEGKRGDEQEAGAGTEVSDVSADGECGKKRGRRRRWAGTCGGGPEERDAAGDGPLAAKMRAAPSSSQGMRNMKVRCGVCSRRVAPVVPPRKPAMAMGQA